MRQCIGRSPCAKLCEGVMGQRQPQARLQFHQTGTVQLELPVHWLLDRNLTEAFQQHSMMPPMSLKAPSPHDAPQSGL